MSIPDYTGTGQRISFVYHDEVAPPGQQYDTVDCTAFEFPEFVISPKKDSDDD